MDADWYGRLGKRIARQRAQLGWTQELLAERAGIGPSYVARIESGSRRPTLDVLGKIAAAMKVPVQRLVTDDYELRASDMSVPRAVKSLVDAVGELDAADVHLLTRLAVRLRKE